MVKIIAGVLLMCLSGGAWLYLDCLNKREQEMAAMAHTDVAKARMEAKRRADAKASLESRINDNLTSCMAAADKAYNDYSALIQQAAPSKRGKITVPKEVTEGSAAILAADKANCQQAHDARLQSVQ